MYDYCLFPVPQIELKTFEAGMSHSEAFLCQMQHYDVPKYLNQIYSLLLLVIECSRVNSLLLIFLFFQMYIGDLK